jgi:hypothetical protein
MCDCWERETAPDLLILCKKWMKNMLLYGKIKKTEIIFEPIYFW